MNGGREPEIGNRMSSAPSRTNPATAGDDLCLRFFAESGEFTDLELRGLCAWWSSARSSNELLVPLMIRSQVFHARALEELRLMESGYVSFSTIHHLFLPGGLELLRKLIQPHLARQSNPSFLLQTVSSAANSDTVRVRGEKSSAATNAPVASTAKPDGAPQSPPEARSAKNAVPDREPDSENEPPATQLLATLPIIRKRSQTEPPAISSELPIGAKLGPYQLLSRIGRGPKGIVYEAEDLLLNRKVAVKLLAPEMAGRGSAWPRRFLQEARLASRIDHPSVLGIFAVGREPGLVYYSMPLMRSGSTNDILKLHGPFPPIEATRIAKQVARALAIAHAHGLSHGNIKPSNVFVGEDNEVRIADFTVPHLPLTGDHGAAPTDPLDPSEPPASTVPELRAQDVATDLRLLGATYHWLLTGKPPPDREQDQQFASLPSACARIISMVLSRRRGPGYASASEMSLALAEAEESLRITETSSLPGALPPIEDNQFLRNDQRLSTAPGLHGAEVGQILGKCLLTERIGHGSSGAVFRARHQTLNIPVAVKVLHIAGDSGIYRQLKSEARLLAQLNHPNIVRVWDFEDDPAMPYLVLEYIEGPNVAELIQQNGRLSAATAIRIAAQVASGLAAAQNVGIVHRDVKPGNILLARDGNAKLADLGLAVFVDREKGNPAGPGLAGTVAYMPPEQAMATGAVDHRSDIYSLGASLYHMVTGQIPFQGSTRMEVILKHAKEAPLPPRDLAPDLPESLSDLILKMMAKSPGERFQSYDELIRALDEISIATSIQDPKPSGWVR